MQDPRSGSFSFGGLVTAPRYVGTAPADGLLTGKAGASHACYKPPIIVLLWSTFGTYRKESEVELNGCRVDRSA